MPEFEELSPDQQAVASLILDDIQHGRRKTYFLTGPAGSGKSFVVKFLRDQTRAVVTATTGVAAQLLRGRTIHSVSGWSKKTEIPDAFKTMDAMRDKNLLIVDEISMLHADFIQELCNFQGMADNAYVMLFVGDLLQLPPVNKLGERFKAPCFKADAWKSVERVVLTTQHRQDDPGFIAALSDIRIGRVTERVRRLIAERSVVTAPLDIPVLSAKNIAVSVINGRMLDMLPGPEFTSKAEVSCAWVNTEDQRKEFFKRYSRYVGTLRLRRGARVILLNNNLPEWYNGSLGTVEELPLAPEAPVAVRLDAGGIAQIEPLKEELFNIYPSELEDDLQATVWQYPIRLAWALTIHKSQGCTLEKALIDLECPHFAPGQTYVAMSRVKTKEGLYLKGRNLRLQVDPECLRESGAILP